MTRDNKINRRSLLLSASCMALTGLAGCLDKLQDNKKQNKTESGGQATVEYPNEVIKMTITEVIDGDTIVGVDANNNKETIRLLGVDTPELNDAKTSEWTGIDESKNGKLWLENWAEKATKFMKDTVLDQSVFVVIDENADRRGTYDRLLAYIYIDDMTTDSINLQLLQEGYAKIYPTEFSLLDSFKNAEAESMDRNVGVWDYNGLITEQTPLGLVRINSSVSGDAYKNLNKEYITIKNIGKNPISFDGWYIEDESGLEYVFPDDILLEQQQTLTVHSGSGENSESDVYWNSSRPIWNDGSDTIQIFDDADNLILEYQY